MRVWVNWACYLGTGSVMMLAGVGPTNSADYSISRPTKSSAPVPFLNWTGFYLGGHLGYGRGHANDSFADPVTTGSNKALGSLFGGVQLGYNHVLKSGLLLGIESNLSFPNFPIAGDVA